MTNIGVNMTCGLGPLGEAIQRELNKHCAEQGSNTPDFVLAGHLLDCLETFNRTMEARNAWYGRSEKPAQPATAEVWSEVAPSPGTVSDGFRVPADKQTVGDPNKPLVINIIGAEAKVDKRFAEDLKDAKRREHLKEVRKRSVAHQEIVDAAQRYQEMSSAHDITRELCILALQIGGPESVRRFADAWCGQEGK